MLLIVAVLTFCGALALLVAEMEGDVSLYTMSALLFVGALILSSVDFVMALKRVK